MKYRTIEFLAKRRKFDEVEKKVLLRILQQWQTKLGELDMDIAVIEVVDPKFIDGLSVAELLEDVQLRESDSKLGYYELERTSYAKSKLIERSQFVKTLFWDFDALLNETDLVVRKLVYTLAILGFVLACIVILQGAYTVFDLLRDVS